MLRPITDSSLGTQLISRFPIQLARTTGVEQCAKLKLEPPASGVDLKFSAWKVGPVLSLTSLLLTCSNVKGSARSS